MGQTITLTATDGHTLSAYTAGPADAARALVVVQEIFGVNHHLRTVADLGALALGERGLGEIDRRREGLPRDEVLVGPNGVGGHAVDAERQHDAVADVEVGFAAGLPDGPDCVACPSLGP